MYARIARIGLRPGTEDQDLRALRAQGVPAFESLDGFVSLTAYLSRDDHVGYLVTHWDSRDHALAVSSAASVRDFFERIQDTVAAPPTIEVCEVAYSV